MLRLSKKEDKIYASLVADPRQIKRGVNAIHPFSHPSKGSLSTRRGERERGHRADSQSSSVGAARCEADIKKRVTRVKFVLTQVHHQCERSKDSKDKQDIHAVSMGKVRLPILARFLLSRLPLLYHIVPQLQI